MTSPKTPSSLIVTISIKDTIIETRRNYGKNNVRNEGLRAGLFERYGQKEHVEENFMDMRNQSVYDNHYNHHIRQGTDHSCDRNFFCFAVHSKSPGEAVAELLVPAFLPFNLIKAGANTGLTLLLYRPVIKAYSGYMQEQTPTGGRILSHAICKFAVGIPTSFPIPLPYMTSPLRI